MRKEYKSEHMEMFMENGILEGVYKADIFVDLETAKMMIEERKKLSNYQTVAMFIDGTKIKGLTKEARNYFGSKAGYELLSAAAILSDSVLSTFIINFFIKVNLHKTSIPVKLFTDKTEALNWLEQYK